MKWIGNEAHWPEHSRAETQKALKQARNAGWMFAAIKGHSFGRIRCGVPGHTCGYLVFSTPSGDQSGAVAANAVRAAMRACLKLQGSANAPVDVVSLLSEIERLVESYELLRNSESVERKSVAKFEAAINADRADDEEQLLFESESLADRATDDSWRAKRIADAGGFGEPWPPQEGAAELHEAATEQIRLVRVVLADAGAPDRADVEERLGKFEARLA